MFKNVVLINMLMICHIRHCARYTINDLAILFLKISYETVLLLYLDVKIRASRTKLIYANFYTMKVSAQDPTHILNLCSLQPSASLHNKPAHYIVDRES